MLLLFFFWVAFFNIFVFFLLFSHPPLFFFSPSHFTTKVRFVGAFGLSLDTALACDLKLRRARILTDFPFDNFLSLRPGITCFDIVPTFLDSLIFSFSLESRTIPATYFPFVISRYDIQSLALLRAHATTLGSFSFLVFPLFTSICPVMKRQPREIEHLSYVPDDQLIMPTNILATARKTNFLFSYPSALIAL